jgi:hypothetical protein
VLGGRSGESGSPRLSPDEVSAREAEAAARRVQAWAAWERERQRASHEQWEHEHRHAEAAAEVGLAQQRESAARFWKGRLAVYQTRARRRSLSQHLSPFVQNRSLSWNIYRAGRLTDPLSPSPPAKQPPPPQPASGTSPNPSPRTRRLKEQAAPEPAEGSARGAEGAARGEDLPYQLAHAPSSGEELLRPAAGKTLEDLDNELSALLSFDPPPPVVVPL